MSDEEKIQIAALGLLGLFNRKPKSRKSTPETKEDPGVIEPNSIDSSDSSDPEDSDGDKLPDRPGAGSPPRTRRRSPPRTRRRPPPRTRRRSGGRSRGSGGRRETKEQEETPQQKLDRIKSNPNAKMILSNIDILFDEIDRNNDGFIQLRELVIAIKRNKRVQRIFGLDSIREGRNNNYVVELFRKIDTFPPDDQLSKDELILFLFRKENIQMLNMLKGNTEAIVLAHKLFDANRDGDLSTPELARGYEQQGETIEDAREHAREFLRLRDRNKNDVLDESEFARSLVYGEDRPPAWFADMVNTNFERAQRGELPLNKMSRPYGPRTPPVDRAPVVDPRTPMTDPKTPRPQRRQLPQRPKGPYRPIGPDRPPRGRRIPNIDMQPGRSLDDPTTIPPQGRSIETPYDGPEQPPGPLAPFGPDNKKKKKKTKKKAVEKGGHHATQAKAQAKQIMRDAGVLTENDDGTVEYKIDQTNVSAWERVIKDIKALNKKQAFSLLYQAVLKGMYKDTRTSKSSNISLKDLKSGKVLKPGGFEKYIRDYLTDPNQRGLRQVDQYKAATIATLIIDDLKKGINLFNEYKPRGRGKSGGKAKPKKPSGKTKTPEPETPINSIVIQAQFDDEFGNLSSSDDSDDEEDTTPKGPVIAPPSTPEVVVRSMSPTPEFDPGVQGLLDSLVQSKPSFAAAIRSKDIKNGDQFIITKGKNKDKRFIQIKELTGPEIIDGKRPKLFKHYAPVANTLEELKVLYDTHKRSQTGVDVNMDWEGTIDRYTLAFLKDPAEMKEDVKKYAKQFFGYVMSDSDYINIRIPDRKAMAFLYGMPASLKKALVAEKEDEDLLALNLKPTMKLRF